MFINNKDISTFSASLIDRQISTANINSSYDWLYGAPNGILLNQKYDFKTIQLTFYIDENNEDLAYKQISTLTEALRRCQVKFKDIDLIFPCFLDGQGKVERAGNGKFKVTYSLKNDRGVGDNITQVFDLNRVNCKPILVSYFLNWQNTMGYYLNCFDEQEQIQLLGNNNYWVNLETLENIVSESATWDQLFLNLGVNLQQYRPVNAQMGTISIALPYSKENAIKVIEQGKVSVMYMKFSKDGFPDLPEAYYPSLVWTTTNLNKYYIDLGVGLGWDIADISVYVTGRYYQTMIDGNGCIIGAGANNPLNIAFIYPDALIETDEVSTNRRRYEIFSSSTSGGDIAFQTLESISNLPLRKYGFRTSSDSSAPIDGLYDLYFNGIALDRVPIEESTILTSNLTLLYGNQGIGKWAEASRVQVYYKGVLMVDAIPINGNVKNGFINSYDTGFYDMVNMQFLPWVNYVTSEVGPMPNYIMTPSGGGVNPSEPSEYNITFNANGGVLAGNTVFQTINQRLDSLPVAPTREGYIFNGWFTSTIGGTKISVNTTFTSDMIVYAQWINTSTIETYTITLNPNGGSLNSSAAIRVEAGKTIYLPTPTREGYIFNGWFTSAGAQFTNTSIVNTSMTLYAHWTEIEEADSNICVIIKDVSGNILNTGDKVYKNTKIQLTSTDSGAIIKYTLDGSDPKVNGIIYTTAFAITEETTIMAVGQNEDGYGSLAIVALTINNQPSSEEVGAAILQYDEVVLGTFDIQFDGLSASKAADWDVDSPRALLPFAAVYSIPGIEGTWKYYSSDWMKPVNTGMLNDGRAFIVFDVTTATSKQGAWVSFTPSDNSATITQKFNILSLI